jgi:hypothetical protein
VWKTASRAEVQRSSICPTLTDLFNGIKDCDEFLDNTEKQLNPVKTRPKDKILTKLKIAAQEDYLPTPSSNLSAVILTQPTSGSINEHRSMARLPDQSAA